MRNQRSFRRIAWAAVLVVFLAMLLYTVYDNHRFKVVEQEIWLEHLPASFDGFRILQISDLHGRYFGDHQADLIEAVNRIDYDMIALTGDMNSSTVLDSSITNSKAVLDLLNGIEDRQWIFWVDGNSGPYAIENQNGMRSGNLTEIGKVLQEKGCKILLLPVAIERGPDKIWITPDMAEIALDSYQAMFTDEAWLAAIENLSPYQSYFEDARTAYRALKENGEVKVMLTHAPKQTNLTVKEIAQFGDLEYDLILAGHYHGGQFRLPLIGAFYIPSPTSGLSNSGFFPSQEDVKGLSRYGTAVQYVSAGLGASDNIRLVSFRLFNPPEINVITLKRK